MHVIEDTNFILTRRIKTSPFEGGLRGMRQLEKVESPKDRDLMTLMSIRLRKRG